MAKSSAIPISTNSRSKVYVWKTKKNMSPIRTITLIKTKANAAYPEAFSVLFYLMAMQSLIQFKNCRRQRRHSSTSKVKCGNLNVCCLQNPHIRVQMKTAQERYCLSTTRNNCRVNDAICNIMMKSLMDTYWLSFTNDVVLASRLRFEH